MTKTRTVFEEMKYLKGRISRAKKACADIESKLPDAEKLAEQVAAFEHSENKDERKAYIYASYDLAALRSDLAKKRTEIFFDESRLEELSKLKAEVESSILQQE